MISSFILIIGAMKSGTTTLYDYLARHPQIATGREKEPGFFAFEEKWSLGLDWYESQFDFDPARHAFALDASTDYTKHPFCKDVVERLKSSAPRRFKLIYIMRHPLRRMELHARHAELEKCEIGRCPSPRQTHSFDAGISPVSIAISRYAYQIDFFSDYYNSGELLLLTLEQLEREPSAVLERVCNFLEIDPLSAEESLLKSNVAKSPSDRLRHRFYSLLWQASYDLPYLRRAGKFVIPGFIRDHIYRNARMSIGPTGRFVMNPEEVCAITNTLKPDLLRLRKIYGIDVTNEWGIDL